METDPVQLGREVVQACLDMGFAQAGVAEARASQWADEFRAWLAAGEHGTMRWMEDAIPERLDPCRLLPGARGVILVADQYAARGGVGGGAERPGSATPGASVRGAIARYARGRDYHSVIKKRLHRLADRLRARFPGQRFRSFVDTAPVMEREHAVAAGLGWIGKHTLLMHPRLGSYLLLGGIITTLDIGHEPDQRPEPDHCGTCTRCIDACPTGAITPHSVDARRCISYLTIEHEGPIEPSLRRAMGEWIFGCDICQEVCPFNAPRERAAGRDPESRVNPAYAPRRASLDVLAVLGWGEANRRGAFGASAMRRAGLDMMKRNALIVAGNALRTRSVPGVLERVRALAEDPRESELVRQTARDVLAERAG